MIAIYNLEPKYFNLALEKVRAYYESRGEKVDDYKPLWHEKYDKIYCSSLFTFTDKSSVKKDMICGGTGFDITVVLPPEIERTRVFKNIGFTTRGCIRHCPFCIVPQKEGSLKREHRIEDFWDGKSKTIELLDNNWLADRQWFFQNAAFCATMDITIREHGMDIRLVDDEIAEMLSNIKFKKQLHFAWDMMAEEKAVKKGLKILFRYIKPRDIMIYVLTNFNTSMDEDMYRIQTIRSFGCDPFIMVYNSHIASRLTRGFARWINRYQLKHISFEKYLQVRNLGFLLV